jgi:hypothetical protein
MVPTAAEPGDHALLLTTLDHFRNNRRLADTGVAGDQHGTAFTTRRPLGHALEERLPADKAFASFGQVSRKILGRIQPSDSVSSSWLREPQERRGSNELEGGLY